MKIDWKKKLTSRKFWAAVVGFVTSVLTAVGCADNTVVMATSVIMAGAVLIAYIVGEGLVDAENLRCKLFHEINSQREFFRAAAVGSKESDGNGKEE